MEKRKYYVVWNGVNPGIYDTWADCQQQIKGFKGAIYKSFATREAAEEAYSEPPGNLLDSRCRQTTETVTAENPAEQHDMAVSLPAEVIAEAIAVDAACSGNPGPMEYRGVYLRTGKEIFHYGPVYGTNNIGEFLAIVHALALLKQKGIDLPVYSDSRNAIGWVKQKCCKTKLERSEKTAPLFDTIQRAENWLRNNQYASPLLKWETNLWGEVPADFGRK